MTPTWLVVARKEAREAWLGGRALALLLAYAVFLSAMTFLLATDKNLSLLAQRDAASLAIQLAVTVGAVLVAVATADSLSGERERATLESLLATPARRVDVVAGKALAGFSLWLGAYLVLVPYALVLSLSAGVASDALLLSLVLGSLLSVAAVGLAILVSAACRTNRTSLSISLLGLLLLMAPTQLPPTTLASPAGQLIVRANPASAATRMVDAILANNHTWTDQAPLLVAPVVAAVVGAIAAVALAPAVLQRKEAQAA